MRIAIINATFGIGSTGKIVKDIYEYAVSIGDECKVFCGISAHYDEDIYQVGNRFDQKIHSFLSRITGLPGYFSDTPTRKLLEELKRFNPDIVHIHNVHANYINLAILFDYLANQKIKTFITLHDCFMFTGKCVHYTKEKCFKWQHQCGHCPNLNSGNPVWFMDQTKKMLADKKKWYAQLDNLTIIGVSKWILNEAKRASVFNERTKFSYIYNWVETNDHEKLIPKKLKQILCVASVWDDSKGIEDIYQLAELLDNDFKIIIVGKCKKRSLNEKIIYFGEITKNEELKKLYREAIVLFHPSLEETFGLVIAESMAVGTPVIVYDSTACSEIVGENCGFVESPGDLLSVKRDIERISSEKIEKFAESCCSFVTQHYNKKQQIKELYKLYNAEN